MFNNAYSYDVEVASLLESYQECCSRVGCADEDLLDKFLLYTYKFYVFESAIFTV